MTDTPPRFVCDMMLGKLSKWLRILGYDTLYPEGLDDPELAELAGREDRVLLTRDKLLSQTHVCQTYYVASDEVLKQLEAVAVEFSLDLDIERPYPYRCSKCNHLLQRVPKTEVQDRVPPKVYELQEDFWYCGNCEHFYWQGTHWDNITETINELLATMGAPKGTEGE